MSDCFVIYVVEDGSNPKYPYDGVWEWWAQDSSDQPGSVETLGDKPRKFRAGEYFLRQKDAITDCNQRGIAHRVHEMHIGASAQFEKRHA